MTYALVRGELLLLRPYQVAMSFVRGELLLLRPYEVTMSLVRAELLFFHLCEMIMSFVSGDYHCEAAPVYPPALLGNAWSDFT